MPIPPCEQAPYDLFYPAVITQTPAGEYYDLGPENFYPGMHDRFASAGELQKFQQKFRPRHGTLHFCHFPDPDYEHKKAYHVAMEEPLAENAGIDHPYPVPFCADAQHIRRVLMVPNRNGSAYVPETTHYEQPLGYLEKDMTIEQMRAYEDYFLEKEGGAGYCQLEVNQNPSQYALYWAYNRDAAILDKCETPGEDLLYVSNVLQMLNDISISRYHESLNPSAVDLAPQIVSEIAMDAGFIFTYGQQKFLEEIAATALHYGVYPHELSEIAMDCAGNSQTEDEFVYSVAVISCLRIANELNFRSVSRGGSPISENFPDIARKVEEAIRQGDIKIKVENIGAQNTESIKKSGAGIAGIYFSDKDELIFQPVGEGVSLFMFFNQYNILFNILVHECVHVYQDIMKMRIPDLEAEQQAYETEIKALILLKRNLGGAFTDLDRDFFSYEFGGLEDIQVRNVVSGMQCMMYDKRAMDLFREYRLGKMDLMDAWNAEIKAELFYGAPSQAGEIFIDLYREKHLYSMMNREIGTCRAYISENFGRRGYYEGNVCPIEISVWMRSIDEQLDKWRGLYHILPEGTPEGGEAAINYMMLLGRMIAYSYYVDPPRFEELYDEFLDEFDNLSYGIIYYHIPRDGV